MYFHLEIFLLIPTMRRKLLVCIMIFTPIYLVLKNFMMYVKKSSNNQIILDLVKNIIYTFVPPAKYELFLFGSRANNTHTSASDYDIGILWKVPLKRDAYLSILSILDGLPANIDFVDFTSKTLNPGFRKEALKNIIKL